MSPSSIDTFAMGRKGLAWLVAAATLLVGDAARADVVTGPAPEDTCADGTRGGNCMGHGFAFCVPRTCVDDSTCANDERCQEVDLCIEPIDCGFGPPDAGPDLTDTVEGSCGEGRACSVGTCETLRVCLTDPVFDDAGGCDCAIGAPQRGGSAVATGLVLFVLALQALRTRRR